MTKSEIRMEIKRVEELLLNNKHPFTIKQNRKYLKRLKNELYKK